MAGPTTISPTTTTTTEPSCRADVKVINVVTGQGVPGATLHYRVLDGQSDDKTEETDNDGVITIGGAAGIPWQVNQLWLRTFCPICVMCYLSKNYWPRLELRAVWFIRVGRKIF